MTALRVELRYEILQNVKLFTYLYLLMAALTLKILAPDGIPTAFKGGYMNQTAIYVTWNVIPILSRNGIIQSYNIAYRKTNSSEDWKVISVDSQTFRVEIGQLQYNTFYNVKVAGRTLIGQGPYSAAISIRTDSYGMKFLMLIIIILAI